MKLIFVGNLLVKYINIYIFLDLVDALRDRSIFLSVENEGLLERIDSLKCALNTLRNKLDNSNRKLRKLSREHSKCAERRKIKYLYR